MLANLKSKTLVLKLIIPTKVVLYSKEKTFNVGKDHLSELYYILMILQSL